MASLVKFAKTCLPLAIPAASCCRRHTGNMAFGKLSQYCFVGTMLQLAPAFAQ
ncbi:MAG: hypothetical protein QM726_14785 [Chitinophagaceae bacterium]